MSLNVLITSVSKKVWLVKAFKSALCKCRVHGNIISVDMNPFSAAAHKSDRFYEVPKSLDTHFISKIVDICKKESIRLIIPTRDAELQLFAEKKRYFRSIGVEVMVSESNVINVCNDKFIFSKFLKENEFRGPETWLPEERSSKKMVYPLIVNSRYGSGSHSVFESKNKIELDFFIEYVKDPIVHEFIAGTEYTIDVFSDFNGKVISVIPRERIEVFSGESYKSKTVKDWDLITQAKDLVENLGAVGHTTLQCKKLGDKAVFIEMNPRYGGAASLGFEAGADTTMMLLQLIQGKKIYPQIGDFTDNLLMMRYTEDIFLYANDVK
jgi:carbamoyl-phosphate synthase large subunit